MHLCSVDLESSLPQLLHRDGSAATVRCYVSHYKRETYIREPTFYIQVRRPLFGRGTSLVAHTIHVLGSQEILVAPTCGPSCSLIPPHYTFFYEARQYSALLGQKTSKQVLAHRHGSLCKHQASVS